MQFFNKLRLLFGLKRKLPAFNYCVYMHRNRRNGRVYVGITTDPESRWMPSKYRCSKRFYKAIQADGWETFDHYIVSKNHTKYEARIIEEALISAFDQTCPEHTYNTYKR